MTMTLEGEIHFRKRGRGWRREIAADPEPLPPAAPHSGRVPRVARLMALAIRFDELLAQGVVKDYVELAELGRVSRARITQIMNLRMLAPDLQEQLLFLPSIERGREPLHLAQLQSIALVPDWRKQRRLWNTLCRDSQQTAAATEVKTNMENFSANLLRS